MKKNWDFKSFKSFKWRSSFCFPQFPYSENGNGQYIRFNCAVHICLRLLDPLCFPGCDDGASHGIVSTFHHFPHRESSKYGNSMSHSHFGYQQFWDKSIPFSFLFECPFKALCQVRGHNKKYKKYLIYSKMLLILSSLNAAQEKTWNKTRFWKLPKKTRGCHRTDIPATIFSESNPGAQAPKIILAWPSAGDSRFPHGSDRSGRYWEFALAIWLKPSKII